MSRIFLFCLIILLTGCYRVEIQKSSTPKWVKDIKNGNFDTHNGTCFYSVQKYKSSEDMKKLIRNDIYNQISHQIVSFISSNTEIEENVINNKSNKNISNMVDVNSFAFIKGIPIDKYYREGNKLYAMTCIEKNKLRELEEENNKKIEDYIKHLQMLDRAIRENNKEKAETIISYIKSTYPMVKSKYFQQLVKKASNLLNVHFDNPKEATVGEVINVKVLSNKNVWLAFILKNKDNVKVLKETFVIKNKETLIPLNIYNLGKIVVYISFSPLHLKDYLYKNKNLDFYIDKLKQDIYIEKKELKMDIKAYTYKSLCIKGNDKKILSLVKDYLVYDYDINCKNYHYLVYLNVRRLPNGLSFHIRYNNQSVTIPKLFNIKDINYLKTYVIPELADKISNIIKEAR